MVGQGRTQSTSIVIATNNQVRRQRRRVHRQRTIINNDYDDEIVITNVPNSTQTIFRDKKSWKTEGGKKYEEYQNRAFLFQTIIYSST